MLGDDGLQKSPIYGLIAMVRAEEDRAAWWDVFNSYHIDLSEKHVKDRAEVVHDGIVQEIL